jgi:hypothetical protein
MTSKHDMVTQLERGAKWNTLPIAEQLALRAIARRIVAMAADGTTPEDWQQLAGYAEWVTNPARLAKADTKLTVAGQWVVCNGESWIGDSRARVDIQYRSGRVTKDLAAGAVYWLHTGCTADVIAYRLVG